MIKIVTATRFDETEDWETKEYEFDGTFAEWVAQRKPNWERLKDMTPLDYVKGQIAGGHWKIVEPANWESLL